MPWYVSPRKDLLSQYVSVGNIVIRLLSVPSRYHYFKAKTFANVSITYNCLAWNSSWYLWLASQWSICLCHPRWVLEISWYCTYAGHICCQGNAGCRKHISSAYSIAWILKSDNGSPFNGYTFLQFAVCSGFIPLEDNPKLHIERYKDNIFCCKKELMWSKTASKTAKTASRNSDLNKWSDYFNQSIRNDHLTQQWDWFNWVLLDIVLEHIDSFD